MIDERIVKRIVEASNVVDVIGDFYELKKSGNTYKCLCPFHEDRHIGSFMISERKNIYKCFSCGKQGDSVEFLREHEGLSFEDAIRWLGKKYSIDVPGDEYRPQRPIKPIAPRKPLPKVPMLELDYEKFVKPRLTGREDNKLVKWLKSLPWQDNQVERIDKMLQNYQVGHSPKNGATIFYQIDEEGRVRTGKLMQYKTDGHRDKDKDPSWVHSALFKADVISFDDYDVETCLFGQHLISLNPKTVNIVESEKTALICAIAYGDMIERVWLATGGKSMLNSEKLKPLIDRKMNIVLYPDIDAIEEWQNKVKEIGYKHLSVADRWMREHWKPEDGDKADIGDIIVRMITPGIEKVLDEFPALKPLHEKLGLELISIRKK